MGPRRWHGTASAVGEISFSLIVVAVVVTLSPAGESLDEAGRLLVLAGRREIRFPDRPLPRALLQRVLGQHAGETVFVDPRFRLLTCGEDARSEAAAAVEHPDELGFRLAYSINSFGPTRDLQQFAIAPLGGPDPGSQF